MNLQILSQRGALTKKSFDFQGFSHSAGAKTPLTQKGNADQAKERAWEAVPTRL